jgi:hypothetical protein
MPTWFVELTFRSGTESLAPRLGIKNKEIKAAEEAAKEVAAKEVAPIRL